MAGTSKTQRFLQNVARWLVILVVVLSPWLFGAAEPWAYLPLCQLVGVAAALWLFSVVYVRHPRIRAGALTAALLALVGYAALQSAPLPPAAIKLFNPLAFRIRSDTVATFQQISANPALAETFGAPGLRGALSLSPAATQRSLYLLIACAGIFLVVVNTVRDWNQLWRMAVVIVVGGFVLAVFGIVQKYSRTYEIYWFHEPRYGGDFFGPFSNRNHFAAHMNMLFGVALGLFLSSRRFYEIIGWRDWRHRLMWLSTKNATGIALAGLAVMMIGGAACLSLSRGAMLSLILALVIFGVIASLRRQTSVSARSGIAAVTVLLIVAAMWLGRERIATRFGSLGEVIRHPLQNQRTVVMRDTLRIVEHCPATGCGFGSFAHVFPMFQTESLRYRWLHAHNDWAQLVAEGGVLGAGLFVGAVILAGVHLRRNLSRAPGRAQLMVWGLMVGLVAISIHSLVDYSLRKPANAFLLCAVAGMAVAAVQLRRRESVAPVTEAGDVAAIALPPERRVPSVVLRFAALAGLVGVVALQLAVFREWRGELAYSRFAYLQRVYEKSDTPLAAERVASAACAEAEWFQLQARSNADTLLELSTILYNWGFDRRLDRSFRTTLMEKSLESSEVAVLRAPSDYLAWVWMARQMLSFGASDEADLCLKRARELVSHREQVRMFNAGSANGRAGAG